MIRIQLSERIKKTAAKLPPEVRERASKALADVGTAFGGPHTHRELGLRKVAGKSCEIRVHLQWRVGFVHDGADFIAYDIMNHDEVNLWLRGKRK